MVKPTIHVLVTGGAGQVAYNVLFQLARGEVFGKDQPIALHILEVEAVLPALEGVKMELEDCACPLLKEVRIGSNPYELFKGIQYAILVGAKPRGPGMERGDLLNENAKIFVEQGKALNEAADPHVKVFVAGNPCNTNCLIAMQHAPRIPKKNFHAMTRLDQNRAISFLAKKAQAEVADIKNVVIWGNHSSTLVPDFVNATIKGQPATEVIHDNKWLQEDFLTSVQKRGAAIIAARGKSSAASAAHAICEDIKAVLQLTPKGEWYSSAVCSDGNPYGIEEGLIFSFPCRTLGNGEYEIVKDLKWNEFLKKKIQLSEQELKEERELVKDKRN